MPGKVIHNLYDVGEWWNHVFHIIILCSMCVGTYYALTPFVSLFIRSRSFILFFWKLFFVSSYVQVVHIFETLTCFPWTVNMLLNRSYTQSFVVCSSFFSLEFFSFSLSSFFLLPLLLLICVSVWMCICIYIFLLLYVLSSFVSFYI